MHCYRNGNYGSPTITLSPDGSSTIIDYRNPSDSTAVNSIEHFGVLLRQLSSAQRDQRSVVTQRQPATVNGQVPVPGGGSCAGDATDAPF